MSNPIRRRNHGREEEEYRPRNPDKGGKYPGMSWPYDNNPDLFDNPPWSSSHEDETATRTSLGSYTTAFTYTEHSNPSFLITSVMGAIPTISPEIVGAGSSDSSNWNINRGPGKKIIIAAAVASSMMVLILIGIIAFFCLRKQKRQRLQQTSRSQMQQLKNRQGSSMLARTRTSTVYPQYAPPPNLTPPPPLATPQPVILGPIAPGSNGAYYTGIDTSDVMSVHDRAGLGNPFADGDSLNEEPPPPYRPRSLGPMSRNTSLRASPAAASRTNATGGNYHSVRSPFADPLDDDAISDISGPTMRGSHDRMSVVSDLSYQEDPIVTRPAV